MVPASSLSLPSLHVLGQVPSHLVPAEWLPATPWSLPGVPAQSPAPCVGAPGLEGPPWTLPPTAPPSLLSEQFLLGEARGRLGFKIQQTEETQEGPGDRIV